MGFCVDIYKKNKKNSHYIGGSEIVNVKNINWEDYDKKEGNYLLEKVLEQNLLNNKGINKIKKFFNGKNLNLEYEKFCWFVDFGY